MIYVICTLEYVGASRSHGKKHEINWRPTQHRLIWFLPLFISDFDHGGRRNHTTWLWLAIPPISAIGGIIIKILHVFWIVVKNWFCLLWIACVKKIGGSRAWVFTASIFRPKKGIKNRLICKKWENHFYPFLGRFLEVRLLHTSGYATRACAVPPR